MEVREQRDRRLKEKAMQLVKDQNRQKAQERAQERKRRLEARMEQTRMEEAAKGALGEVKKMLSVGTLG